VKTWTARTIETGTGWVRLDDRPCVGFSNVVRMSSSKNPRTWHTHTHTQRERQTDEQK